MVILFFFFDKSKLYPVPWTNKSVYSNGLKANGNRVWRLAYAIINLGVQYQQRRFLTRNKPGKTLVAFITSSKKGSNIKRVFLSGSKATI
jgi:hypothetical protein